MKTLKLNTPILDLSGVPFVTKDKNGNTLPGDPPTLANILASSLVGGAKVGSLDPIKIYDWAMALYKHGEIQVDESDFNALKDYISNSETLTILAKGQLLRAISHES